MRLEHFRHCCFEYCCHQQDLCKATEPLDAQFLWLQEGDNTEHRLWGEVKPQCAKSWFPSKSKKTQSGVMLRLAVEVRGGSKREESASSDEAGPQNSHPKPKSFLLPTSSRGQLILSPHHKVPGDSERGNSVEV